MQRLSKQDRQRALVKSIEENPFITDEDLAKHYFVSIQTIRLDRLERGIPELRERMKSIAEQTFDHVRSLNLNEIIGDVIDLQLDSSAISLLEIKEEHVFHRTKIARGHHLFAQANSLAIATMNQELALTAMAEIRFLRPVILGEKCIAKAKVNGKVKAKTIVEVRTYVNDEIVFSGIFTIYRSTQALEEEKEVTS
ncbi:MAG: transcription factor FapR [Bacilli bacterium]